MPAYLKATSELAGSADFYVHARRPYFIARVHSFADEASRDAFLAASTAPAAAGWRLLAAEVVFFMEGNPDIRRIQQKLVRLLRWYDQMEKLSYA